MESSRTVLARALLTTAGVAACLALVTAAPGGQNTGGGQRQRPVAPAASASTTAQTGTYVGEATCVTCHEDHARSYHDGVHSRAWSSGSPAAGRGCESCHGPGQAHVDASGDKSKIKTFKKGMPAREIDAQCLTCHLQAERALWEGSAHDTRNVSCVSCHSMHAAKSRKGQLKAARQVETCEACHRAEVRKLRRSSHMPIDENKLECSSCHNPHGASNVRLLKAGTTINQSCESCHADKRGPYLWEHAPVVEKCTTCHDPHGSTNDRMLVAKEPFLCQRCHVASQHPATVYDGYVLTGSTSTYSNRLYGRSCAACHQNIHGSNAPSGKAFLR